MTEPVAIVTDQFALNTSTYGATLNFLLSDPVLPAPGSPPKVDRQATVRMSLEHLKVMSFILLRSVKQYENQTNTTVQIPMQLLNSMGMKLAAAQKNCWR